MTIAHTASPIYKESQMARLPQLLDRWGNPVRRQVLTTEVAAPTLGGVRTPISGYPGDGLNPARLAQILRAADQGDPLQYLELAETIEERDPHYLGVPGTRKRPVSQIEVTVEAASDDPEDVELADMIRDWLRRDELTGDLFHRCERSPAISSPPMASRVGSRRSMRITPYICKIRTSEPDRFIPNPINQMTGLNSYVRNK